MSLQGTWRVIPKKYEGHPLGIGRGNSRFSAPNEEFKILYTSQYLETAIRKTLVRYAFDNHKERKLSRYLVNSQSCVIIESTRELTLLDLNDGNPNSIGLSSDIRHSKKYDLSNAFALEVFLEMPEIDGFYYRSRLDDKMCYAIFERSVTSKLWARITLSLDRHPQLREILLKLGIEIDEISDYDPSPIHLAIQTN